MASSWKFMEILCKFEQKSHKRQFKQSVQASQILFHFYFSYFFFTANFSSTRRNNHEQKIQVIWVKKLLNYIFCRFFIRCYTYTFFHSMLLRNGWQWYINTMYWKSEGFGIRRFSLLIQRNNLLLLFVFYQIIVFYGNDSGNDYLQWDSSWWILYLFMF